MLVCILFVVSDVSAQQQDTDIEVVTLFVGNISLEKLTRDGQGTGTLLYFHPQSGPGRPSLVVRFYSELETGMAIAEVFDSPPGMNWVPVQIEANHVTVDPSLTPSIIIKALGGWWRRDRLTNYNLDVRVNGPVYAMWGGGYDKNLGPTSWTALVEPGEPAVSIGVRDPGKEGIPEWDFRYILKPLPGRVNIYANYAERKCKTPLDINLGVSPLWPYVAELGAYEVPNGQLDPPIVVDWDKGKITHFSELVTVRNQNCSYSLYLLNGMDPGKLNQPDFESPFAFYDLSGAGNGFPNLVLRTERYPANDPWSTGLDVEAQDERPVPKDIETVRYSWRNAVGDRLWDYKVEVLGFHPYTFETPIAGGLFTIDAPPYERFPEWVIEKSWPVVTFIDTEGNSYASNEGIYEWSPREVGVGYIFGWEDMSKSEAFSEMYPGFRGEYRFRKNMPAKLYLSPIDKRLHLLGAEGGLWNLGEGLVLHLRNLDDGHYINGWIRERIPIESTRQGSDVQPPVAGEVQESLYALAGYLIYSGPTGVELRQAAYQPSKFEILPPTDKASWSLFRERLTPYADDRLDPKDLKGWLSQFPGKTLAISGGQISDVRATSNGFRFVLNLQKGYSVQENDLFDVLALQPGLYVITYDGHLTSEPLTPPALSVALSEAKLIQLESGTIQVALENSGLEDLPQATLELWATSPAGTTSVVATKSIQLLAQEAFTTTLQWAPPLPGDWVLTPRIRHLNRSLVSGDPVLIVVARSQNQSPVHAVLASISPGRLPVVLFGLIFLATLTASVLWSEWGQSLGKHVLEEADQLVPKRDEVRRRCPNCQAQEKQSKAGFNRSGSQRYRCGQCRRVYTPNSKSHGYSTEIRILALVGGGILIFWAISRVLKVSPQSVANWVKEYTLNSAIAFSPNEESMARLEASYGFIDSETNSISKRQ